MHHLPGLVLCLIAATAAFAANTPPDYARDVRPILADHCFTCHGPDDKARKSSLRLDLRDAALKGGKSNSPAITPANPAASELIKRITTTDEADVMPPPDSKKKLTPAQIETLKTWIAAGAPYQSHWAFVPPTRRPAPATNDTSWPRNDVDRFILARLDHENLNPSPEADRAALLRRLSLDLIGLPPSPGELDDFLADRSDNAYEIQVDRLLASPHFGEKWARHWMDVARYADSDGFEKDLPRKQWAWRDWVIKAINADLPYDRFIIEQLAGDLLQHNPTQDHQVATGFLRNGMVNEEGAIIAEQFRMEGLFDRMDTIGKGVLGLTLQCAQCHTHKYDPVTQAEYYRLMAFINNDYEATTWIYTDPELQQIRQIRQGIDRLEQKLKSDHADWPEKLAAWEQVAKNQPIPWQPLIPIEHEWVGGLAHPEKLPDNSILTLGFRPSDGDLYVTADVKQINITALRLEALTHGDLPFGGPGRSYKGTFAVSELIVEAQKLGATDGKWEKIKLTSATADFEQPEQPLEEAFKRGNEEKRKVGPAAFLVDAKEDTAWGVDRGPGRRHQDSQAVAHFEKPAGYPEGTRFKITLRFKHSGADIHGRNNNFLGRFRLSLTTAPDAKADPVPRAVRPYLAIPEAQRTPEQQSAIFSHWRSTIPEFKTINDQIEALWKQYPEGETVLNLAQRAPDHARQTYIMSRGDWQKPTTPVTPGVPAFLHPLPQNAGADRLTLAKWLVDKNSPTTARVAVNRTWQTLFGMGLVETAEDFGVRAPTPTHPELLDWLAVEFMDKGWSQKQLLRTIVTSATYRQSSRVTPKLLEKDPRNLLLARGPRFRPDAEVVRDVALSTGGILHPRIGGPSFFPPVPESLFALSYLKVDFWRTAPAPERYRRSLYMFRRRSMPDPLLAVFDAPNGDVSCARRPRSNTPLSALAGLNEPVLVEAARALALRTLREGGRTDVNRAAYAFRLCTARHPKPAEVSEIITLLQSQKQRIQEGWLSAREIATGDPAKTPEVPQAATPTEAAAWTIVARVLLNLDETVTKN